MRNGIEKVAKLYGYINGLLKNKEDKKEDKEEEIELVGKSIETKTDKSDESEIQWEGDGDGGIQMVLLRKKTTSGNQAVQDLIDLHKSDIQAVRQYLDGLKNLPQGSLGQILLIILALKAASEAAAKVNEVVQGSSNIQVERKSEVVKLEKKLEELEKVFRDLYRKNSGEFKNSDGSGVTTDKSHNDSFSEGSVSQGSESNAKYDDLIVKLRKLEQTLRKLEQTFLDFRQSLGNQNQSFDFVFTGVVDLIDVVIEQMQVKNENDESFAEEEKKKQNLCLSKIEIEIEEEKTDEETQNSKPDPKLLETTDLDSSSNLIDELNKVLAIVNSNTALGKPQLLHRSKSEDLQTKLIEESEIINAKDEWFNYSKLMRVLYKVEKIFIDENQEAKPNIKDNKSSDGISLNHGDVRVLEKFGGLEKIKFLIDSIPENEKANFFDGYKVEVTKGYKPERSDGMEKHHLKLKKVEPSSTVEAKTPAAILTRTKDNSLGL